MNYFDKSSDYTELINQLAFYRDAHELDRAANQALQLTIDDLCSHLSSKRAEELKDEETELNNVTAESLDDIILNYGVPDGTTPEDIILSLAEDGYIDAANEDEYYRALEAAEQYLAQYDGQWAVE
jgi:hypothetical protein